MSYYYISYKQVVPWNGTVFNANEYRKKINEFYSKIDLVNPNLKSEQSISSTFNVPVKDLSPDSSYPNEWSFDLSGYFSTTPESNGYYRSFLTLSSDVEIPRKSRTGDATNLRQIISSADKSTASFGNTPEISVFNAYKNLRESILQTLADSITTLSGNSITVERQDPFTDPEPSLPGPPTQTISGVTNKAPVVDNPNIKLPTQEVKGLDANAAQQASSKAQGAANNVTSQVQGSVSQAQGAANNVTSQVQGSVSQAQSAASGTIGDIGNVQQSTGGVLNNLSSGVTGVVPLNSNGITPNIQNPVLIPTGAIPLNSNGITPDGLGKNWSPNKFSPESIAGNDTFVDPKTGLVGSTSKLASGLKGGLLGGALGAGVGALAGGGKGALVGGLSGTALGTGLAIGGVTGGTLAGAGLGGGLGSIIGGGKGAAIGAVSGAAVGAAAAKLASVQKGLPKPTIPKPPNTPRIKTVKIPRPSDTKGATDLLNLPKSDSR